MSDDLEALKACPFCGVKAHTQPGIYGYKLWVGCANAECRQCPSSQFHSESEAIAAWNRRVPDPALTAALADVKRLREALEPFAAVWKYDDVPRHFPEAIYMLNGVRLHLVADDFRRASEARAALTQQSQAGGGE